MGSARWSPYHAAVFSCSGPDIPQNSIQAQTCMTHTHVRYMAYKGFMHLSKNLTCSGVPLSGTASAAE